MIFESIKLLPYQTKEITRNLASLSSPITVAITLDLEEVGDNPSHGGTNITLVH